MEPKSFAAQALAFFGNKPGKNLPDFKREITELSEKDRNELGQYLTDSGFPVLGFTAATK